jgi:hypothetical protein
LDGLFKLLRKLAILRGTRRRLDARGQNFSPTSTLFRH